jgi:hypothetical protein
MFICAYLLALNCRSLNKDGEWWDEAKLGEGEGEEHPVDGGGGTSAPARCGCAPAGG